MTVAPTRPAARRRATDSVAVLSGALITGASSTLMHLSGTTGATVAFFRCLYALPVLGFMAVRELRRWGPLGWQDTVGAAAAGGFLAADLILWFGAIRDLGAGLATVVQDSQVVFVALGAWLMMGSRPTLRLVWAIPPLLGGVFLISGVLGRGSSEADPLEGTLIAVASAVAYAGFLLLIGWRPEARQNRNAAYLTVLTVAACATAVVAGAAGSSIEIRPSWPSAGWLIFLALSTQVFGWLIISSAMNRVTSLETSVALLLQPVSAVLFAWAVLGESPSLVQVAGVAVVVVATMAAMRPQPAADTGASIAVAGILGATDERPT